MSFFRNALGPGRLLLQPQPLSLARVHVVALQRCQMSYYSKKKRAMRISMAQMKKSQGQKALMQEESRDMLPAMRQRSLGQIHDHWVPVPASHSASIFSKEGLRERWEHAKKRMYSIYSAGMMRFKLEKDWDAIKFAEQGQESYIRVMNILTGRETGDLRALATDECASRLKAEFKQKRVEWTYKSDAERPKVVHINLIPVNSKDNLYCQVTVKLSMNVDASNVDTKGWEPGVHHDYVVFEKHLTGKDSHWRIAGNILPLFMLPAEEQAKLRAQRQEYEAKMKERVKRANKA